MDMRLGGERRRILLVRKRQSDSYGYLTNISTRRGEKEERKGEEETI